MTEIRDFDKLSETAKWLICTTIGDRHNWDKGYPDFDIYISDEKVDPAEFFTELAEKIDAQVEADVETRATAKFNDAFNALFDELEEERENLVHRFKDLLRRDEE